MDICLKIRYCSFNLDNFNWNLMSVIQMMKLVIISKSLIILKMFKTEILKFNQIDQEMTQEQISLSHSH